MLNKIRPLEKNVRAVATLIRRNYGVTAVLLQKAPSDPIQKLFVQKIRDYSEKSKAIGGKLVDATPESEKELKAELDKLEKMYGGGSGIDLTKFPSLKFKDFKIDPINLADAVAAKK